MTIDILLVRQAREKAIQVYLAQKPYLIWLPRAAVQDGFQIRSGSGPLSLTIKDWFEEELEKKLSGD